MSFVFESESEDDRCCSDRKDREATGRDYTAQNTKQDNNQSEYMSFRPARYGTGEKIRRGRPGDCRRALHSLVSYGYKRV